MNVWPSLSPSLLHVLLPLSNLCCSLFVSPYKVAKDEYKLRLAKRNLCIRSRDGHEMNHEPKNPTTCILWLVQGIMFSWSEVKCQIFSSLMFYFSSFPSPRKPLSCSRPPRLILHYLAEEDSRLTVGNAGVFGLQLPEILARTAGGGGFWEFQSKNTWVTQGWEPLVYCMEAQWLLFC